MTKIAILGSGLSAAFATRACMDLGVRPDVFSNQSSYVIPKGAIWFHSLPFKAETQHIANISWGTESVYLRKQWGSANINWNSSFPKGIKVQSGYPVAENLPRLWEGAEITPVEKLSDKDVELLAKDYDLVIQSFPTERSRKQLDRFVVRIPILPSEDCIQSNKFVEQRDKHRADVLVVYNGTSQLWVRRTFDGENFYTEYPSEYATEYIRFPEATVVADLHPDCPTYLDPLASNILLVGRYATWDRKVLSHQTYSKVSTVIKKHTMS